MGEIADLVQEMQDIVDGAVEDARKFDGGNNSAGGRVRKAMMAAKKQADAIRKTVQAVKNRR